MTAAAAYSSQALRSVQAPKCRDHQSRDQKAMRFHLGQRNRLQLSRALAELRQGKRGLRHGEQRAASQASSAGTRRRWKQAARAPSRGCFT